MQYHLPESTYEDWARNETRAFAPDERQKQVIEVVRRAIEDEGLYYTRDVYRFVTTAVGVRNGIDRAQERKQRKTSFAEFCEALHQPIQPKPTVATTESESASLF